jgi:hypothetical protein
MRIRTFLASVAAILTTSIALAGFDQLVPVPTLGEAGITILALGLIGSGIAALRRRSR